jgi:hypothetical protein
MLVTSVLACYVVDHKRSCNWANLHVVRNRGNFQLPAVNAPSVTVCYSAQLAARTQAPLGNMTLKSDAHSPIMVAAENPMEST